MPCVAMAHSTKYIQRITPIVNCLARLGNIPIVDGQASQVVAPITDCLARLGNIPIVDGQASQVAASITDCLAKLGSIPIVDGQASQVVVPITDHLARLGYIGGVYEVYGMWPKIDMMGIIRSISLRGF